MQERAKLRTLRECLYLCILCQVSIFAKWFNFELVRRFSNEPCTVCDGYQIYQHYESQSCNRKRNFSNPNYSLRRCGFVSIVFLTYSVSIC